MDIDGFTDYYPCQKCGHRTEAGRLEYVGNEQWCGRCMSDEIEKLRKQGAAASTGSERK